MRTAKKAIAAAVFALCGCGFVIPLSPTHGDSPSPETLPSRPILTNEAASTSTAKGPVAHRPRSTSDAAPAPREAEAVAILNSRSFKIPFNVDSAQTHPVEVRLYVNRGGDSTWEHLESQPPQSREFTFTSDRDGVYWFATRTLDSSGTAHPSGPIRPQLQVVVDTTQPVLNLEAEGDSDGTVHGTLGIEDATAIADIRFYYATDVENQWQPLSLSPLGDDRSFSFQPQQDWRQLSLHVTVVDAAGNQAVARKRLHRPRFAARQTNRYAANARSRELAPPDQELAAPPAADAPPGDTRETPHLSRLQAQPVRFRTVATQRAATAAAGTPLYIHPAEHHPEDASNPIIQLDRKKADVPAETGHVSVATNFGSYREPVQLNQLRGETFPPPTPQPQTQPPRSGAPQRSVATSPQRSAAAGPAGSTAATPPSLQAAPRSQASPRP
ncbi:MAG: hypothetical protein ACF788_10690, partial [Novipirellula sp. JB048]